MKTHTARWDQAILQSHTIACTASIIYAGATVVTGLAVASGQVTLDRTAAQLGRCDIQLAEPYRIPTSTGGVLSPYGYEIAIQRGIAYPDGTTELMPLGVFPIQKTAIDGVSLISQLTTVDRTQRVSDARFVDDYFVAGSTSYATAIAALLTFVVPGLPVLAAPSISFTTPSAGLVYAAGSDPWKAATDMASACGCELFFDGLGTPTLRAEPSFTQAPVWSIVEGAAGSLVGAQLTLDRAQAYNAVVATGENSGGGQVFRAISVDSDPTSPTYYYGGFGQKPKFYASPLITSTAQAQSAADALLLSTRGVARSLNFTAVPNPALEPGDPVQVTRTSLNLNEIHLIDSVTIDLGTAAMTGASRARQQQ